MTAHSELPESSPDSKAPETVAGASGASPDETLAEQLSGSEPEVGGSASIAARLDRIEDSVKSLHRIMNERLRYDDAKETAFNRLYKDLDEHRKQSAGEALRPILRDLVMLHDHIVEAAGQHPREAEALEVIREGLLEVLYRADVEPIECDENQYDRSLQQIRRVEKTLDPAADWIVAEVIQQGFRFGEHVLRPQQVVVRRYEASGPEEKSSNT